MQVDEKDMTIAGFIITWIGIIFGIGKSYGKLNAKVDNAQAGIDEVRSDFKRAMTTPEGEPRFITYPAHDVMQQNCHKNIDLRLSHLTSSNQEIKDDISSMHNELKNIAAAVQEMAVAQAKHHSHRRATDEES